jgi:broad specificity phosphatase PhoE
MAVSIDQQIQNELNRRLRIDTVDIGVAQIVRDRIDEWDLLDWSECTTEEFNTAVAEAYNGLFTEVTL